MGNNVCKKMFIWFLIKILDINGAERIFENDGNEINCSDMLNENVEI